MGNKRFDTWLIQIIGPIYDPQSVFFRTEKKALYANWISFTTKNRSGPAKNRFSVTLSYLILFHPTRSLVYHTQPVSLIPYTSFIKYSYPILPYPIILKLNRIDPRPKRLGSVHHQNLPRPKSPGRNDPNSVVCTAKMLKSFGLVYSPILRLKNVFWREFTGKSEAVHTPLKCKQSRYASKQDIIGYQENVLRTWYAHFQK